MAPQPIEEIDFPDLGDKIRELLLAIWTYICDIFIVLWFYISHAFWVVWTWPPFETFRNDFSAAMITLWDYVVVHPVTATAIGLLVFIVFSTVYDSFRLCLLHCLGFRKRGVLRGSYAAYYQSTSYGGNVPRSSAFAQCQSHGVKSGGRYHAVRSSSSRA